jgi:hypothetical protein
MGMTDNVFGYAPWRPGSHSCQSKVDIYRISTDDEISCRQVVWPACRRHGRVAGVGERSERRAYLAGRYWWAGACVGQRERGAFEWEGWRVGQKRWTTRPADHRDSMGVARRFILPPHKPMERTLNSNVFGYAPWPGLAGGLWEAMVHGLCSMPSVFNL